MGILLTPITTSDCRQLSNSYSRARCQTFQLEKKRFFSIQIRNVGKINWYVSIWRIELFARTENKQLGHKGDWWQTLHDDITTQSHSLFSRSREKTQQVRKMNFIPLWIVPSAHSSHESFPCTRRFFSFKYFLKTTLVVLCIFIVLLNSCSYIL